MHEGFLSFMTRSLGEWSFDKGQSRITVATPQEVAHVMSCHLELTWPLYCYKVAWTYKAERRPGGHVLLGVDASLDGFLFNDGMRLTLGPRYAPYTAPLKLRYAATRDHLDWWSEDGAIREIADFLDDRTRHREFRGFDFVLEIDEVKVAG